MEEVGEIERRIRASAAQACAALAALLAAESPLDAMRGIKFRRMGFDPLDPGQPRNVMQQIHQTFAYLVSLRGAAHLLAHHPQHAPYRLTFGAHPGPDIVSVDGAVAAEVSAAITPRNNNKIASDIGKMRESEAEHRYVFYYAEEDAGTVRDPDVTVVAVAL